MIMMFSGSVHVYVDLERERAREIARERETNIHTWEREKSTISLERDIG